MSFFLASMMMSNVLKHDLKSLSLASLMMSNKYDGID